MPNYYAHLEFGRRVLEALPPALRRSVEREKDAFEVGLYGPDPLLFYHPITRNAVRYAGNRTHRQAARVPMERLRQAMAERMPMAVGYAAGLLCHYALDSACHGLVEREAARGELTHGAIESEFDRRLMEKKFLDPLQDTPMPENELPETVYEAAACAYPGVSPRQFRSGLETFRRASRLLTLAGGSPLQGLAESLAGRYPRLAGLRGVVLQKLPNPACDAICDTLMGAFTAELIPAGEQLSLLLALTPGDALSDWFDHDFSGRIPLEETGLEDALRQKAAGAAGY